MNEQNFPFKLVLQNRCRLLDSSSSWVFPFLMVSLSLAPSCGRSADKFRSFVDMNPDFAEDFLYAENPDLHSGTCHHHQTKTSPSSLNLEGAALSKLSNGICPDFSPNYHATADGLLKKHNWGWDERVASPGERWLFLYVCEAAGVHSCKGIVYISVTATAMFTFSFLSVSAPWNLRGYF